MKAKLSKHVRRELMRLLAERAPQFRTRANPWKDSDLYVWPISDSLACFLFLFFWPGKDCFNIELAWSCQGEFPWNLIGRTVNDEPVQGELRFRIADLWRDDLRNDEWWRLSAEPCLGELAKSIATRSGIPVKQMKNETAALDRLIEDAVDKVCEYAVPYFDRIAKNRVENSSPDRRVSGDAAEQGRFT